MSRPLWKLQRNAENTQEQQNIREAKQSMQGIPTRNGNDEKNRMLERYRDRPNPFLMEVQMPRQQPPPRVIVPPPRVVEAPPLPELPIVVPVILPVPPPVQYNIKKTPGGYGYDDFTTLVLCGKTEEGNPVFESKGRSDKVMGRSFIESALFPIGSKVELTSGDFPIIGYNYSRKKYVMGGKNVSIESAGNCDKLSLECRIKVSAARAGGRRRTKRRRTKRSTRRH